MKKNDDVLRERLRDGDPARLDRDSEERILARMRRRVAVFEPRSRRRSTWRRFLVPLAASVAAVALFAWLRTGPRRHPAPTSTRLAPDATNAASDRTSPSTDEIRQLQFETPSGTRVVWVLDPNLVL